MDEFLSGLTNYTEKENPYHKVDAYPGTDFYNTENILKLFYPLVVFHLHQEFRILCNHKVIGIDELRYYLNYVIIPRVSQYWKQTPTKSDMQQEFETLDIVKNAVHPNGERKCKSIKYVNVDNNQYSIICEEDIQQMDEYIAKYYPDTIAEEEYNTINNTRPDIQNRLEYIMMKMNEYKRDTKIRETLGTLVLVSHELIDILERIKVYLRTIRYASEYNLS